MAIEPGSLGAEITKQRSRRSKVIEEIDVANAEIQTHNRAIAAIQERLKKLQEENVKTMMAVSVLMDLNGEDPEQDIVLVERPVPPLPNLKKN